MLETGQSLSHGFFSETLGAAQGLALILNSAVLPDTSSFPTDTSHWADVRRIYRRICVLRATGNHAEATSLERTDLHRALSVARLPSESSADETAVFTEEADRVASAQLLAELIAPILAERLRLQQPAHASLAPASAAPVAPSTSGDPAPHVPAGETIPGIADLIDSMLSQQRARSSTPDRR